MPPNLQFDGPARLGDLDSGISKEWRPSRGGFSALTNLERLIIKGCSNLKALPDWFPQLTSLKILLVLGCGEELRFLTSSLYKYIEVASISLPPQRDRWSLAWWALSGGQGPQLINLDRSDTWDATDQVDLAGSVWVSFQAVLKAAARPNLLVLSSIYVHHAFRMTYEWMFYEKHMIVIIKGILVSQDNI
ncbi:hypothetical protein CRG98_044985 [Punica granatum]|uniref:Uncharacterized protein n=1 Tax=Punica granatum TaxID=22663 RepID=A0A2I0HSA3_PUNGR|nr:hypothetical protein CRG98_044985 [Punica granatum]